MEAMGVSLRRPRATFWRGRRVLLTGHTGFKGSWLSLWLAEMGAEVYGLALPPDTDPALYELARVGAAVRSTIADLRDPAATAAAVAAAAPEIVLHLAAQPLVRRSLAEPAATFATNVLGTAHLLDALRAGDRVRTILVVTSDKVYANDESGRVFAESDELGGADPYSASKAAVELVVRAYRASYFAPAGVAIATARGGNVVGGGDFAADRLLPDAVRAAVSGTALRLRHPAATRPWQHVLDCLNGYLLFAEALALGKDLPVALNFGPARSAPAIPVGAAARIFAEIIGSAPWEHRPEPAMREMGALQIDASRASEVLGWENSFAPRDAIIAAGKWYRAWLDGGDAETLTREAIRDFVGG